MRVEDRIASEAARQSAAAAETQKTRPSTSTEAAGAAGDASDDRLQLSSLAGRIRDVFDGMAQTKAARVEQLTAAVQSGRYQVDVAGLSRALASEFLGGALL